MAMYNPLDGKHLIVFSKYRHSPFVSGAPTPEADLQPLLATTNPPRFPETFLVRIHAEMR